MAFARRFVVTLGAREIALQAALETDGSYVVQIDGSSVPPLEVHVLAEEPHPVVTVGGRVLDLRQWGGTLALGGVRRTLRVESLQGHATRRHAARSAGDTSVVQAPMAGRVVKVLVAPGDAVEPGTGVVVVEAMKMENELCAARNGRVLRVLVKPGDAVDRGARLVEIA